LDLILRKSGPGGNCL